MRSSDACGFSSNSPTYFDRNFPSFLFFFFFRGWRRWCDLDGRLLAYLVELESNFRGHRFAASAFDPEDHVPRVVGDLVGPVRLLVQTRRRRGRRRLRQETIEQRQRDDDDDDDQLCPTMMIQDRRRKGRRRQKRRHFFFSLFFLSPC